MKKLLVLSISALLIFGFVSMASAEMSAQSMSGKVGAETQVFIDAYNNSGADVTSNAVVILDTTGTANTTLGSYFTTNTTAGSPYIIGVTDQTITAGSVGRICVRGLHRVWYTTAPTAGDTVSNGTTAGRATTQTSTANKYGYLGIAIKATASTEGGMYSPDIWWTWINPTVQ